MLSLATERDVTTVLLSAARGKCIGLVLTTGMLAVDGSALAACLLVRSFGRSFVRSFSAHSSHAHSVSSSHGLPSTNYDHQTLLWLIYCHCHRRRRRRRRCRYVSRERDFDSPTNAHTHCHFTLCVCVCLSLSLSLCAYLHRICTYTLHAAQSPSSFVPCAEERIRMGQQMRIQQVQCNAIQCNATRSISPALVHTPSHDSSTFRTTTPAWGLGHRRCSSSHALVSFENVWPSAHTLRR